MRWLVSLDIGGTKCALTLGKTDGAEIEFVDKLRWPTPSGPEAAISFAIQTIDGMLRDHAEAEIASIGISCGGPLNSSTGKILSPPNLPGWNDVDIVSPLKKHFGVPVGLQNDANACALAEWRWGAGRKCRNMIFLTFGTGMGAGMILDDKLYTGTNDMAGEVGHIRLDDDGPIGYGKVGSFEGFCSGGGMAKLARMKGLSFSTAEETAEAANRGDPEAIALFDLVAKQLGRGLAVLIDILNPQKIIIGSIYARQRQLLEHRMLQTVAKEALPLSMSVCEILPSMLGDQIGDYAGMSVAMQQLDKES
jgi:glucokinase